MTALRSWWRRRPRPALGATPAVAPGPEAAPRARPTLAPPPRSEAGPTMADPERQSELATYGFTVVRLFDADLLAEVRRTHAGMGPAPDDPQVALNWSFHSRDRSHKDAVKALLPALRPALDAVVVDQVAYLTTYITKWPGPHSAFPPHQDPTLVDERRFTGVTVWAPLVAVGPDGGGRDNGMLHVVPGSHRFSSAIRVQDVDRSPFAGLDEAIIERFGVGIPLEAGEALVFDNRLIHYSLPNAADGPRVVLSFGMRPAAGECVVALPGPGREMAIHAVADDFYIDVLPALRDRWEPEGDPLGVVVNPDETWTAEDLEALCAQVGPAPRTVVSRPAAVVDVHVDPGVFCALCGSSEGLTAEDRQGRTNAQLICPACTAALDGGVAVDDEVVPG